MAQLDKLVYTVKKRVPFVFLILEKLSAFIAAVVYKNAIQTARQHSTVTGYVQGEEAVIRYITVDDANALIDMLDGVDEDHLKYFHPHGLDAKSIPAILRRQDIMTYGLFIDDKMYAYAILKLFPTGKAYLGRLVAPEMAGKGIGKFLAKYLYYQASLLEFQVCSTISQKNLASLKSHQAVRPYQVVSKLPDDYLLIKYELDESDKSPPELWIE